MRRLAILISLILLARTVPAQEMFGPAYSNYAGQMGIATNPASIVGAPYRWEIHLVSADFSVLNNFMYLRGNSKLVRKSLKGEVIDEERMTNRTNSKLKFAYSSDFLKYPAFTYSGKKFAAALNVSTRAELSARGIPYELAKFMKEGFDYDPLQVADYSAHNSSAAFINWHEVALTGGMVLRNTPESFITAGLTVNYNYGLNAVYAHIDDLQYNSLADTLLVVYNLQGEYGHAMPDNGHNGVAKTLAKKGGGWSLSGGFRYYRNRNDAFYNPCNHEKVKPYDYRIGVAVTDLGYIRYNKQARTFAFDERSTNWYGIDTTKFGSIAGADSALGSQFYSRPNGARDAFSFRMYTPAALNFDLDVPVSSFVFLNLAVVQRLPVGPNGIKKSNMIAFTPRFESKRFEFAVPVSFYDYFKPRVGVSVRLGILTIGTDMPGPLLGLTDSYGADIYFGITWRHFPACGGDRKRGPKPKLEKCNTPGD